MEYLKFSCSIIAIKEPQIVVLVRFTHRSKQDHHGPGEIRSEDDTIVKVIRESRFIWNLLHNDAHT